MRYALLSLLFASSAHAFTYNYPIECADTNKLIDKIKKEYDEKLTWSAFDAEDSSMYSLWINHKTNHWTLLKMSKSGTSCILGVGTNSTLTLGDAT
jgi:hypothetical protein